MCCMEDWWNTRMTKTEPINACFWFWKMRYLPVNSCCYLFLLWLKMIEEVIRVSFFVAPSVLYAAINLDRVDIIVNVVQMSEYVTQLGSFWHILNLHSSQNEVCGPMTYLRRSTIVNMSNGGAWVKKLCQIGRNSACTKFFLGHYRAILLR